MDSPRFITLTLQHDGSSLAAGIARLAAAFKQLRKGLRWRKRVVGGVYCVEVTRNFQTQNWHVHLHAVIDGSFYQQAELSEDWRNASDGSTIVHIAAVHSRSSIASYIAKYVSKPCQLTSWSHATICEYAVALAGKRMVHTWGSCHNIKTDDPLIGGTKVVLEPLVTAGRLSWLALRGCPHARLAINLLTQAGGLLARCVGAMPRGNVPSKPQLGTWEYERLAVCLRHCSGDTAFGLADIDPAYSPTLPLEPLPQQSLLFGELLIHDHHWW